MAIPRPAAPYLIKPAVLRDVHAIRRLEVLVFPKDAYTFLNISTLLMWPGGAHFKALDSQGNLVGFVSATPDWAREMDWIVTLGVHPEHQNNGLGRSLLRAGESGTSLPRLRLTVRASNAAAIHLYESEHFAPCYTEPHYYNDGEDGIVMEKIRQAQ